MATLYLGFEGVLHPQDVVFREGELPRLRAVGHQLFENGPQLERVLKSCPDTRIVLHTWWVPRWGYIESLRLLPQLVQLRVIGATWPGNRVLRFQRKPVETRRAWLEADLHRRRPTHPVLLDCDQSQVPNELIGKSCIVDGHVGLATVEACEALVELLGAHRLRIGRSPQSMGIPSVGPAELTTK